MNAVRRSSGFLAVSGYWLQTGSYRQSEWIDALHKQSFGLAGNEMDYLRKASIFMCRKVQLEE